MPYEVNVDGMREVAELLDKLDKEAPRVAAQALYEGAGIMADAVKSAAEGIRTAPFKYAARGQTRPPSPEEKEIVLQASAGIARFEKNGVEVNTSVGFRNAGYAELKGKTVPIPVIVNAINSGTSFMSKQPFVRKAASSGGKQAIAAMSKVMEAEFEALTK